MSKAKFDAARELISEKQYDAARAVLNTIDNPTAQKWLAKLDAMDPPFPVSNIPAPPNRVTYVPTAPLASAEQEKFYTRENRKARRRALGSGIELVMLGILCFGVCAFFAMPRQNLITGRSEINLGFAWVLIPIGLVALVGGLRRISKRA